MISFHQQYCIHLLFLATKHYVSERICGPFGDYGFYLIVAYKCDADSRIELALRIPEPGKNWNINETF